MSRFIKGQSRTQSTMFSEVLDDYVHEENPIRAIDMFINSLELSELGFARYRPAKTGRPSYSPATMLKIYLYSYLNRIHSSRRLEKETQRNVELMWLVERLSQHITHAACWAHTRRHFEKALDYHPKEAQTALAEIQKLYKLEAHIRKHALNADDTVQYRLKHSEPAIAALFNWLYEQRQRPELLPKDPFSKALAYAYERQLKIIDVSLNFMMGWRSLRLLNCVLQGKR